MKKDYTQIAYNTMRLDLTEKTDYYKSLETLLDDALVNDLKTGHKIILAVRIAHKANKTAIAKGWSVLASRRIIVTGYQMLNGNVTTDYDATAIINSAYIALCECMHTANICNIKSCKQEYKTPRVVVNASGNTHVEHRPTNLYKHVLYKTEKYFREKPLADESLDTDTARQYAYYDDVFAVQGDLLSLKYGGFVDWSLFSAEETRVARILSEYSRESALNVYNDDRIEVGKKPVSRQTFHATIKHIRKKLENA